MGRNVGNYFTGGTEEINQPGGRDEVIGQKNKDDYFTVGESLIGEKDQGSALQYQIQPTLAEGVLQAHKGSVAVQTNKNRSTGLNHPYNIEYYYTSRFPIGFRGCFVCGATDHFGSNNYPVGINNTEEKREFFFERVVVS